MKEFIYYGPCKYSVYCGQLQISIIPGDKCIVDEFVRFPGSKTLVKVITQSDNKISIDFNVFTKYFKEAL